MLFLPQKIEIRPKLREDVAKRPLIFYARVCFGIERTHASKLNLLKNRVCHAPAISMRLFSYWPSNIRKRPHL